MVVVGTLGTRDSDFLFTSDIFAEIRVIAILLTTPFVVDRDRREMSSLSAPLDVYSVLRNRTTVVRGAVRVCVCVCVRCLLVRGTIASYRTRDLRRLSHT